MLFLTPSDRAFLERIARITSCNPFLPERIEQERKLLGPAYVEEEPFRSFRVDDPYWRSANFSGITESLEDTLTNLRDRLAAGVRASATELRLYHDAAIHLLYRRHVDRLSELIRSMEEGGHPPVRKFYSEFRRQWGLLFEIPGVSFPAGLEAPHAFACLFQIQRAYHHIFRFIVGQSLVAARLRAAVWQSIFTHDLRRYCLSLYDRMTDMTTLVTGPSGTGKELVAQAIGLSQYVAFDPEKSSFAEDFFALLHPLNLSALPSTLIESELFGHKRGSFTGAIKDRQGWLESCQPGGSLFLDEIGDLDAAVQVKLLRVLETRLFQPVGDSVDRQFRGKILAATNRDLAEEMQQGRFREDLYYRLCSDVIETPSLREQLREAPGVLRELLQFIARKVAGDDSEALAEEVESWIGENLGDDYAWPGNFRELEQCTRSVLIRKRYTPVTSRPVSAREGVLREVDGGVLTAEEVLSRYCTLVYAETRNYQETARRLELDHRTVKRRVDPELLAELS